MHHAAHCSAWYTSCMHNINLHTHVHIHTSSCASHHHHHDRCACRLRVACTHMLCMCATLHVPCVRTCRVRAYQHFYACTCYVCSCVVVAPMCASYTCYVVASQCTMCVCAHTRTSSCAYVSSVYICICISLPLTSRVTYRACTNIIYN